MGIISDLLKLLFSPKPVCEEPPSPSDIIPIDAIEDEGTKVVIETKVSKIHWTKPPRLVKSFITDSKSMLPAFGTQNNHIMFEAADDENHEILCNWLEQEFNAGFGNVAVYDKGIDDLICHRIVGVDYDEDGRYFTFKGDTPGLEPDPLLVRDCHIRFLAYGVVY